MITKNYCTYEVSSFFGVIDYIQSNETAKKLPDKAVKALDMWIDNIQESDTIKVD